MEYIIIGDTEKFDGCLITVSGSKEQAERDLERMTTNPNDNDKALMKGHKNLRIKAVAEKDCWWNDPVLCN